jgi:hypothetical protein
MRSNQSACTGSVNILYLPSIFKADETNIQLASFFSSNPHAIGYRSFFSHLAPPGVLMNGVVVFLL